ncbi:hypothetical protein Tco_1146102 [Tanacetum coccineum]
MAGSLMYLTTSHHDLVFVVCIVVLRSCRLHPCQDSRKSTSGSAQFLGEKTKHIVVRYHFIKEQVENEIVKLYFVKTNYQLADICTKALARERFEFLIKRLGMQSITPEELKSITESEEE